MSGIHAISAVQAGTPGEAWQALLQASLHEADATAPALQPPADEAPAQEAAQAAASTPPVSTLVSTAGARPAAWGSPASVGAPAPAAPSRGPDAPEPLLRQPDHASAVLPMTPALLQPLQLRQGPELHWRAPDASAWRRLFDDAGQDADDAPAQEEPPDLDAVMAAAQAEPMPAWAQGLLTRLREAAASPASAAALRPAVQAWCVGLPVLLASPAGLASLQPSRDASVWQWRRWPARWRAARPAQAERWWAVRLGLGPQGRPRTVRELATSDAATSGALAPGQVSCELRLGDVAPGIAHWTAVLVQANATPSLRQLLAARPSLTWLLCNQTLWPQEGP